MRVERVAKSEACNLKPVYRIPGILAWILLVFLAVPLPPAARAQTPRDADEAHAWRLYNQYSTSKEKLKSLRDTKRRLVEDRNQYKNGGLIGGSVAMAGDRRLTEDIQRVNDQIEREVTRQERLERAWERKFWGRYGELKASNQSIYDPTTRRNMSKTEFRLRYFPYRPKPYVKQAPRNNRNVKVRTIEGNRPRNRGGRQVRSGEGRRNRGAQVRSGRTCNDNCATGTSR